MTAVGVAGEPGVLFRCYFGVEPYAVVEFGGKPGFYFRQQGSRQLPGDLLGMDSVLFQQLDRGSAFLRFFQRRSPIVQAYFQSGQGIVREVIEGIDVHTRISGIQDSGLLQKFSVMVRGFSGLASWGIRLRFPCCGGGGRRGERGGSAMAQGVVAALGQVFVPAAQGFSGEGRQFLAALG